MNADAPCDVLPVPRRQNVVARGEFDDLAARGQPFHDGFEFVALIAAQPEIAEQMLEARPSFGQLRDVFEYRRVVHSYIMEARPM